MMTQELHQEIAAFPVEWQPTLHANVDILYDRITGKTLTAQLDELAHAACAAYLESEARRLEGDAAGHQAALARMADTAKTCLEIVNQIENARLAETLVSFVKPRS